MRDTRLFIFIKSDVNGCNVEEWIHAWMHPSIRTAAEEGEPTKRPHTGEDHIHPSPSHKEQPMIDDIRRAMASNGLMHTHNR